MATISMFTEEERHILNPTARGAFGIRSREEIIRSLAFNRQAVDDYAQMMLSLLDSLIEKMTSLSDAEWQEMSMFLPFPVMVTVEEEQE